MGLLRKVGVIVSSVAMLATLGVSIIARSASAATFTELCVFAVAGETNQACDYYTNSGEDIVMAYGASVQLEYTADVGTNEYGQLQLDGGCIQGYADEPDNGGWSAILENCKSVTGQYWRAVTGPVYFGDRTYYWVNEYNPAYCLAWDKNQGTLFVNVCESAWYQQLGAALGPTNVAHA